MASSAFGEVNRRSDAVRDARGGNKKVPRKTREQRFCSTRPYDDIGTMSSRRVRARGTFARISS
jgi:hypothetical protein